MTTLTRIVNLFRRRRKILCLNPKWFVAPPDFTPRSDSLAIREWIARVDPQPGDATFLDLEVNGWLYPTQAPDRDWQRRISLLQVLGYRVGCYDWVPLRDGTAPLAPDYMLVNCWASPDGTIDTNRVLAGVAKMREACPRVPVLAVLMAGRFVEAGNPEVTSMTPGEMIAYLLQFRQKIWPMVDGVTDFFAPDLENRHGIEAAQSHIDWCTSLTRVILEADNGLDS